MKYAILVAALVMVAFLVINFNNRTALLNTLTAEKATVEIQVAERSITKGALQTQIAYATSEAAVMEYAYNNHMLRPGDVGVVPVEVTRVTSTPVPVVHPVIVRLSHLQKWLLVLFGP